MAQYATAYPDSRTRGKISLNNSAFVRSPKSSSGTVIPTDLLLSLILSKSLLAITLYITKEWLMRTGIPTLAIWSGYLILGAPMVLVFRRPWIKGNGKSQVSSLSVIILAFAQGFPRISIYRSIRSIMRLKRYSTLWPCPECQFSSLYLSPLEFTGYLILLNRLVMFTQFSKIWFAGFSSTGKGASNSSVSVPATVLKAKLIAIQRNANFVAAGMLMLAMMSDLFLGSSEYISTVLINYLVLTAHLLCSSQARQCLIALQNDPSSQARIHAIGLFSAAALSVPISLLGWLSTTSALNTPNVLGNVYMLSFTAIVPLLGLLAIAVLLVDPFVDQTVASNVPTIRHVANGWPIAICATAFVGYVAFEQGLGLADVGSALVVYRGK